MNLFLFLDNLFYFLTEHTLLMYAPKWAWPKLVRSTQTITPPLQPKETRSSSCWRRCQSPPSPLTPLLPHLSLPVAAFSQTRHGASHLRTTLEAAAPSTRSWSSMDWRGYTCRGGGDGKRRPVAGKMKQGGGDWDRGGLPGHFLLLPICFVFLSPGSSPLCFLGEITYIYVNCST
jgi:hypothetical protein